MNSVNLDLFVSNIKSAVSGMVLIVERVSRVKNSFECSNKEYNGFQFIFIVIRYFSEI